MAEQKTKPTERSVGEFLDDVADANMREDCFNLVKIMKKITGYAPVMWGPSIVGFGSYHYRYESGREGDCCLIGFSPGKQNLSLYVMAGFSGQEELLKKIGKHKAGKGCLYIKALKDVDITVLESLIRTSLDFMKKKSPPG